MMLAVDTITRFQAERCRPTLRNQATEMIHALLAEDAADLWASHPETDGDSITPDDLAGLVPPPRNLRKVDDARLSCMLQDFAVMAIFAIQSGQFDNRALIAPLMALQSSACAVALACKQGASRLQYLPMRRTSPAQAAARASQRIRP